MSLPRFNVLVLSLSIGITSVMVGCSSNPKKVVDTGPQSSEQVYYEKAVQALDKGQYTEAGKQLEALDTYFPTGRYSQQAQLDLMYTKFKQGNYAEAVTIADRFIRLNPQHPQADYAYYLRGVANMEQNYDGLLRYTSLKQAHRDTGYLKVAYQNFADFIRRYTSSKYAVDAAQRMQFIGQELAESEMNAARFNIERKAWVAALQRARWVLEYYPQAPQTAEAIATAAYAYQQLGDQESAQQYIKLLQANYPELLKSNGTVNLKAARHQASLFNRFSLGIFGRSAQNSASASSEVAAPHSVVPQAEQTPAEQPKRSWLNRLSLGLLDKDQQN
ncbi:outer membrane protein assembly factor BamD [Acinetobacter qingfengensis]|uniref:Outer membrane protein assembly factor BamD n=1 Tax=Acinetobacter qingfengensis TaxID=1262585 RepID=A0A1E7RFJ5_9GAMM|nr:outer membrane protein assembly factor BamD [Acinetobacter qingfengensis]KAA8732816.1 outer membrane protein assembly factor BamD [Acinetobacter qingfengensis]OEY98073.1 outer membrane protein assembly factor BamD [Acinetobacter qingfengensis]